MTNSLDQEIAFYLANRAAWIKDGHQGKWILVVGTNLHGMYASFDEALQVAMKNFPTTQVLIRQIDSVDRVESILHVFPIPAA